MAHDFNNLLAAITGFTDLLLRRPSDQRQVTCVTGIRDAALRGAALDSAPGRGSTFRIYLPSGGTAAPSASARPAPAV